MLLHQTFCLFDRDGGGEIDTDELEDVLRSMGMKPTDHQMEEIINELDENRDGTIEFSEFLKVMASGTITAATKASRDEEILNAFKVISKEFGEKILQVLLQRLRRVEGV